MAKFNKKGSKIEYQFVVLKEARRWDIEFWVQCFRVMYSKEQWRLSTRPNKDNTHLFYLQNAHWKKVFKKSYSISYTASRQVQPNTTSTACRFVVMTRLPLMTTRWALWTKWQATSPSCGQTFHTAAAAGGGVRDRCGAISGQMVPQVGPGRSLPHDWEWRGAPRAGFLSCKWFYKCDIKLCYRWARGERGRGSGAVVSSPSLWFPDIWHHFPFSSPPDAIMNLGAGARGGRRGGTGARWAPYCSPLTTLCGAGSLLHCLPSKAHCSVANPIHFPAAPSQPQGWRAGGTGGLWDYCCCRCRFAHAVMCGAVPLASVQH